MPFKVGDEVRSAGDGSKIGIIRALGPRQGGIQFYVVFWGGVAGTRTVPETDLLPHQSAGTPTQALADGLITGYSDFQRILILHRLSRDRPLRNNIFAFNASRTQFYPFQFKPLIKLLDSGLGRLLICDEVGLGKTIETGLILLEERARRDIRTALVVCPSGLQAKWELELRSRFDERFTILDSRGFAKYLEEYRDSPERVRLNGIVSLESLRRTPVLQQLQELQPELDFLVFDEAHWLRNPSNSRSVALTLGESAGTLLLLTATPVHLGEENLFSLLHLLDAEDFPDLATATERFRQNAPIVRAQRLLVGGRRKALDVLELLKPLSQSTWLKGHPLLPRLVETLERLSRSTDIAEERELTVDAQRSLAGINLLGHIFTRTRKRDVKLKVAVRRPMAVTVVLNERERLFYDAVVQLVAAQRKARGGRPVVIQWALGTLQRRLASSIHAMAHYYREQEGLTFDDRGDEEFDDLPELGSELDDLRQAVKLLISTWAPEAPDSKYEALRSVVIDQESSGPSGKVLVFAFFKETLRYLSRRLAADQVPHQLIDGDVPIEEREIRIRRFRDDESCRVLLSSRVGSEGLDFQFCDTLVNYDLPWNPMEVEQRIGRLDRIGQAAERILILNLWTEGTIEERILQRLYDRIGVFERSIGALDGVLGDVLADLDRLLISPELSEAEQAAEADRIARVVETERQHLEELETQSGAFIGVDEYFEQEVAGIQRNRRYITGEQLLRFIEDFVAAKAPNTRIGYSREQRRGTIHPDKVLQGMIRSHRKSGDLIRFLGAGGGGVPFTVDSSVAFEVPDLEFINVLHPIVQVIRAEYQDELLTSVSAQHVALRTTALPRGTYLFGVYKVIVSGVREVSLLETVILDAELQECCAPADAEGLLGEMVERGTEPPDGRLGLEPAFAARAVAELQRVFLGRLPSIRSHLEETNNGLVDRKMASVRYQLERQLKALHDKLAKQQRAGQPERVLQLTRGQINKREALLASHLATLASQRTIGVEHVEAAAGILEVLATAGEA